MSDHVWTQENLDAFLAGGLYGEDRERALRHLAECTECTATLAKGRKLEASMKSLFADARPDANFEERAIHQLRRQPTGPRPWVRYVMAAAAVLVLGFTGAVVQAVVSGEATAIYQAAPLGELRMAKHIQDERAEAESRPSFVNVGMDKTKSMEGFDVDVNYMKGRIAEVSVPGSVNPNEVVGLGTGTMAENGKFKADMKWHEKETDRLILSPPGMPPVSPNSSAQRGFLSIDNSLGTIPGGGMVGAGPPPDPVNLPAPGGFGSRGQGGAIESAPGGGTLISGNFVPSGLASMPPKAPPMPVPGGDEGKLGGRTYYKRHGGIYDARTSANPQIPINSGSNATATGTITTTPTPSGGGAGPGGSAPVSDRPPIGQRAEHVGEVQIDGLSKKGADAYGLAFKLGDPKDKAAYFNDNGDKLGGEKSKQESPTVEFPPPALNTQPPGKEPNKAPPKKESAQPENQEQPKPAGRKIIRTGEIEFETESFDNAVDIVTKLIDGVKGRSAFIATTNSDKLSNGKMKGSVVVRMPPEHLDKFITDLRKALGPTSELKGQRIGSLDVTKQYTDIESRLRAAHTMEDRLINIIKTGKGEVKDLVAAEKELGVWRTKIEEMEGEIRYYNNQISLSTLTITLTEKEIQAPFAVVVRETVRMHVEVEEVEKAQATVVSAAQLAKGRITKSELKLFEAGQLRAIVQAEIPPGSADTFRDLVKKLGIVTHHESERTQQAEGGTGKLQDGKTKVSDVHFDLQLFNTANIKPRETFTIRVASSDVAGNYQKLKDAVTRLKGRVRKGALDENDKPNMFAEFDFDIFVQDRAEIEKLIAASGSTLHRKSEQAPINQIATSSKIGYQLMLRNLASVMPRETFAYEITTADVAASFRKLYDEVTRLDGRIITRQLNEQDKYNVRANFDFDISAKDKAAFDKLLQDAGMVILRDSAQAANKDESTDLKVGYRLALRSITSVAPRDIYTVIIASKDVPTGYRKLHDEVARLKGRVHKGQLNEQDRFNINATFDFDLDAQDKVAMDKLLGEVGVVLSRKNDQAGPKDDATDLKVGYRLVLGSVAGAAPREKSTVIMQVSDVDKNAIELKELITASKGRVVSSKTRRDGKGQTIADVVYEVPFSSMDVLVAQIKNAGTLLAFNKELNPQVPDNELATGQIFVTLSTIGPIIPSDEGIGKDIRTSLYWAFWVLSKCLLFIVVGLAFVVPWVIVLWLIVKAYRWMTAPTPAVAFVVATPEKPASGGDQPAAS